MESVHFLLGDEIQFLLKGNELEYNSKILLI